MSNRETLKQARELVIRNILAGERPGPDEMVLMSEPYKEVWVNHDNSPTESGEPDWAIVLDKPAGR